MDYSAIFDNPRGEPARALANLASRAQELARHAAGVEADQRAASEAAAAAADALSALEARALGGEAVSADERRKAETTLSKARAEAGQPWGERRSGARRAIDAHDRALRAYCGSNFDGLASELTDDAHAAADRIDRALTELMAANAERAHVAARFDGLIAAAIGHSAPGTIAHTKTEKLARDCEAILMDGRERPPVLVRDPRAVAQSVEA